MPKYSGRTIRNLGFQGDIWTILDQWAVANNCILVESDQNSRTYLLGKTMLYRRMLKITSKSNGYILEAWIKAIRVQRIGTLEALMPSEYRIDIGGVYRTINRRLAREEINPLLASLGELSIS